MLVCNRVTSRVRNVVLSLNNAVEDGPNALFKPAIAAELDNFYKLKKCE